MPARRRPRRHSLLGVFFAAALLLLCLAGTARSGITAPNAPSWRVSATTDEAQKERVQPPPTAAPDDAFRHPAAPRLDIGTARSSPGGAEIIAPGAAVPPRAWRYVAGTAARRGPPPSDVPTVLPSRAASPASPRAPPHASPSSR